MQHLLAVLAKAPFEYGFPLELFQTRLQAGDQKFLSLSDAHVLVWSAAALPASIPK